MSNKGVQLKKSSHEINLIRKKLVDKYGSKYEQMISGVILGTINSGAYDEVNYDNIESRFKVKMQSRTPSMNQKSEVSKISPLKTLINGKASSEAQSPPDYGYNYDNNKSKVSKRYPPQLSPLKGQNAGDDKKQPNTLNKSKDNIYFDNYESQKQSKSSLMKHPGAGYNPNSTFIDQKKNVFEPLTTIKSQAFGHQKKSCDEIVQKVSIGKQPYFIPAVAKFNQTIQINNGQKDGYQLISDYQSKMNPSNQANIGLSDSHRQQSYSLNSYRKRQQNYTMWDVIALQDAYKSKINDQYQRQMNRQRQVELQRFLEKQQNDKEKNENIEKQKVEWEKEELLKNIVMNAEIDKNIQQQKQMQKALVQRENVKQYKKKLNKTVMIEQKSREIIQLDNQRTLQQYEDLQVLQNQRSQDQKNFIRQELKGDIQQRKQSQEKLAELAKLQEIETVNNQLYQFQVRDKKLADHIYKIQLRDNNIQTQYKKPNIITHTKLEELKTNHVEQLAEKQAAEVHMREMQRERHNKERKMQLIQEMLHTNLQSSKQSEANKSVFGSTKYSVSPDKKGDLKNHKEQQIQEYYRQMQIKDKDKMLKSQFKQELDKQIVEKEKLKQKERIYLDPKQLATSKEVLRQISPDYLKKAERDSEVSFDDIKVGQEIGRLNSIIH